jgi:hypothetical protein
VPGVGFKVVGQKFIDNQGRPYYLLVQPVNGSLFYVNCYPNSPTYAVIDRYFTSHSDISVIGLDRSAIPGGASTPAAAPGM